MRFSEPRALFELDLPDGWVHAPKKDEDLFFHHDRTVGVLSVTTVLSRDGKPFSPEAVEGFARAFVRSQKPARTDGPHDAGHPTLAGFHLDATIKNRFVRAWFLRTGMRMFFLSYNCALAERGLELATVTSLVRDTFAARPLV